jgi:hypothetical protein
VNGGLDDGLDAILPELGPEDRQPTRARPPWAILGVVALVVAAFVAGGLVLGGGDEGDGAGSASATSTSMSTTTTSSSTTSTTTDTEVGPTAAPAVAPAAGTSIDDLAGADRAAEQMIAALQRRDCDGVMALLSARTLTFLSQSTKDGKTGREDLCRGLDREPVPPMTISRRAYPGPNGSAIVELTSDGDTEEIVLVHEGGRWKIDLLGAPDDSDSGSDDRPPAHAAVQSELRNAMTVEQTIYADDERYTDDVRRLDGFDPGIDWRLGVVDDRSQSGVVYVALARSGQIVCVSGMSSTDRERFMIKSDAGRMTFARGAATPSTCDGSPLGPRW